MDLYQQMFFTTLAISFALLHSFLYLFNKRLKSNLYFSLFLILYALNIFFDYQVGLVADWPTELLFLRLHRAVMPYNPIFILLFSYSIFEMKIPKQFWIIVSGLVITGALSVIDPIGNFGYIQVFMLLFALESSRIIIVSVYRKKEGAKLIGFGFAMLILFSCYDVLMDVNVLQPFYDIKNGYPFGFLCLIFVISIYLSRDFSRINRKIIEHEISNKEMELKQQLLEDENKRKTKELTDARNLQLSMLPECVTELNGLEICFSIKTATEVGGDYFDYVVADDNTLTLAIGDATGHGMKAGMMVAIMKSLFLTQNPHQNIPAFLNTCSRAIKQLQLGNLYMAMMILKIKDDQITASSAGMPPIFVYRSKSQSVEDFVIKGMPLGALNHFDYQTIQTRLEPGDTVLLMSDGLAETFNENKEMLDYKRIEDIFKQNVHLRPSGIVEELFKAGDKWRGNQEQDDDVTFIVFKYHPNN